MNKLPESCWYLQAECKCQSLCRSSAAIPLNSLDCFVFLRRFNLKPQKIKSRNHNGERSKYKYFIIWYFLCKGWGLRRLMFRLWECTSIRLLRLYFDWARSHFDGIAKLRPGSELSTGQCAIPVVLLWPGVKIQLLPLLLKQNNTD